MSSLYKLSISGVRSFSPKDTETIQFGSPLTLICGQNGCGKTTIIESLKYATTGDLPPNSKGGAFVNDPTIADRSVVNAEIKLGFISVDGKSMTVTRNMQLNRKRAVRGSAQATNTFKTLEGQLAVISRGQKTSISTKNLELDTRVPLYLGASRAILEYVIFCHQDDSLWPLSEAGVLKKRFDEIFEASKFTKVLDNLKAIRKDMATDIKLIQQSVQHAQLDKNRAQKIREKLHESTARAEEYSGEIAEITMQIEALEREADQLFHSNQDFQQTLSEHERLRLLTESTSNALSRLGASINVVSESTEELSSMATNFEQIKAEKGKERGRLENELGALESSLAELQHHYHKLVRDEGSLSAKKKAYDSDVQHLMSLKQKFIEEKPGRSLNTNDDFRSALVENERAALQDLESLGANCRTKKTTAAKEFQDASDNVFKEQQHLSYCDKELAAMKDKLKQTKAKLSESLASEQHIEEEKSQLEILRVKIGKLQDSVDIPAMAEQIEKDKNEVSRLELELEELMRKIHTSNKSSDLLGKVDLLKENLEVKEASVERIKALHADKFCSLFGETMSSNADQVVEQKKRELSRNHDELREKWDSLQQSFSLQKSNLQSQEKALSGLQSRRNQHRIKILAVLDENEVSQYESIVEETEENYKTAMHNLNTFQVTRSFKSKAVEFAKTNECCALCNRGMDKTELKVFVSDMQKEIESVTAEQLADDVQEIAEDLNRFRSINIDIAEYRLLELEITDLISEIEKTRSLQLEEENALNDLRKAITESRTKLEEVDSLMKPMASLSRVQEEILNIKSQLSVLDEKLLDLGVPAMSITELQKQQQQKTFELKNLRSNLSDVSDSRIAHQKDISRLENQFKDKELLISRLELSSAETLSLQNTSADLEKQISTLKESKAEIEGRIAEFRVQQESKKQSLEDCERTCEDKESQQKDVWRKANDELTNVESVLRSIDHFENHEAALVQQNNNDLIKTSAEIDNLKSSMSSMRNQIKDMEKFINDAQNMERNIRDNMEYRELEAELERFQNSMASLDIESAEGQKIQYQEQSKKLRDQISELNSRHHGKLGEVKQIKDQIRSLQNDLKTDFNDIDKQYHNEWIKLQTNLLVSADIQTYSQALDSAIMKYHSMKMDEINRILRELWNQTYRGTDIDGIEIKCDVTNQTRGRSYNYRVVMYKKNSELDMRGRCSAGQKVLTSILIRLALAECFGSNCGMIALDEPTTNLDVENSEALAGALNSIIEFRKGQKNFQLIVITHDEKFLSHINGDQYTDNFYRVERDENQHSVIKSLPIHLMQDE